MPQNTVSDNPAVGYAGQLTEPNGPKFARSAIVETLLHAGAPCKRGTNAEKQIKPWAPADVPTSANFAGVVLLDTSRPYEESPISVGSGVSVLRMGTVFMEFAEAVTAGEMVGITLATGALTGWAQGTAAGSITTGIVILPGLRIAETTTAAGIAAVEVNLYGAQDSATVGSG